MLRSFRDCPVCGHSLWLLCGPLLTTVPCDQDEPLYLLYSSGACWIMGFLYSFGQMLVILWISFCGPNVIDHFCCDIFLLLQLAYVNTFIIGFLIVLNGGVIPMNTFMMLLMSYVVILCFLKTHNSAGRKKALATCGSHIIVCSCSLCHVFIYTCDQWQFSSG